MEEIEKLRSENEKLKAHLRMALPIVEEAYWDANTAAAHTGVGYRNKAQDIAGKTWGRWDGEKFRDWLKELTKLGVIEKKRGKP